MKQQQNVNVVKPKTNAMKRSFSYAAAKVWNSRVSDTVVSQS